MLEKIKQEYLKVNSEENWELFLKKNRSEFFNLNTEDYIKVLIQNNYSKKEILNIFKKIIHNQNQEVMGS